MDRLITLISYSFPYVYQLRLHHFGKSQSIIQFSICQQSCIAGDFRSMEGPNASWINNTLESAIEKYGPPEHILSDHGGAFIGEVFAELLSKYNIKPRLEAIGKHGSIAVTERVNKTL